MKAYIVNGSAAYRLLFLRMGFELTQNMQEAEIACFTGGEDVSPELYGDTAHKYTGNNPERDHQEAVYFHRFKHKKIPMLGVCRGGQLLNVLSGGRMYQHVTHHAGDHEITDARTGETVLVSSTHHQMFMPSPKALLVAYSTLGGTREWYDGDVFRRDVSNTDYEVVYYEHTKCLCFQPHPEFGGDKYEGMYQYFKGLVHEFLITETV
jgi:carbamoylphosphate synthase small subunit